MATESINLMRDDILKTIKLLSSDIFQTKPAKLLLVLLLIIHGGVTLIQIYFFLFKLTSTQCILYAPVFFGVLYGLLAIATLLFKGTLINDMSIKFKMWDVDNVDFRTQEMIKKNAKIINAFSVINFTACFITGVFFLKPLRNENEFFFAYKFFDDHVPNFGQKFGVIYRVAFACLGYVMTVPAVQNIYFTQHSKFQIIMLLKQINKIDDKHYEKEVHNRIKFCVERHNEFLVYGKYILGEIGYLIVVFSLLGCIFGVSIVMAGFTSGHLYIEYYIRVALTSTVTYTLFICFFESAQELENQINNLITALQEVKWYLYNNKNKVIYLIFLANVMKPWQFKFMDKYVINYQLGLTITRAIYAVTSVLIKVKPEILSQISA